MRLTRPLIEEAVDRTEMEEEKAAAYYNDLVRRGEGAARFKQGLGFSSSTGDDHGNGQPARASALPSSSFLSNFVKASSPTKVEKQAQLDSIQNKLKKKPTSVKGDRERDRHHRSYSYSSSSRVSEKAHHGHRSRSTERERERQSSWRSRSRSRERYRDRDRRRGRSRSRSRSSSPRTRRDRGSERKRSRSPRERRRSEKDRGDKGRGRESKVRKEPVDYSRLIEGYDRMTPAERVKAKMKLQLNETAKKDAAFGMRAGWERFEFDKDAPVDDEEVEAANDDAALVKHIGQSFRFSTIEAQREEQIKAAHDEAMFGVPVLLPSTVSDAKDGSQVPSTIPDAKPESPEKEETNDNVSVSGLLSEKVLAKQQGSWRDRARKVKDESTS